MSFRPVAYLGLLVPVCVAPVAYRDVQHYADDDHGRQKRRPRQQEPMMGKVFDVRLTHGFRWLTVTGERTPSPGPRRVCAVERPYPNVNTVYAGPGGPGPVLCPHR